MKTTTTILIALGLVCCASSHAPASMLTFELGGPEFSGSGANAIAEDAVVLTFDDSVGPNEVRLTVTFNGGEGVDDTAKLNDLVFNVDTTISSFAYVSGVSAIASSPSYLLDGHGVDGSKGYDVLFNYPPPGDSGTFTVGLDSVYDILGAGLVASSFDLTNQLGYGPLHAAVHINAVDNGNSGHYGDTEGNGIIPEPSSFLVWGIGLLGCGVYFRRRRFRA